MVDFMSDKEYYESLSDVIIYTGSIDEYFDYNMLIRIYPNTGSGLFFIESAKETEIEVILSRFRREKTNLSSQDQMNLADETLQNIKKLSFLKF
jgi:hypothetical protein